jgi:rhodanese-related sulfurtransferase
LYEVLHNLEIIRFVKHLNPRAAWLEIQNNPHALFVDVRMEVESMYVGRPPGVHNIAWYEYPDMQTNAAQFAQAVAREAGDTARAVYLICRSGQRSQDAGKALEAAGFTDVTHIVHGFEGELDDAFHRNTLSGWRFDGLPWTQM